MHARIAVRARKARKKYPLWGILGALCEKKIPPIGPKGRQSSSFARKKYPLWSGILGYFGVYFILNPKISVFPEKIVKKSFFELRKNMHNFGFRDKNL